MDNSKINNSNGNNLQVKPNNFTKQPDERGSFYVQGHIKIHDPETKEVFVNKRA